jgi:hypothetical protein
MTANKIQFHFSIFRIESFIQLHVVSCTLAFFTALLAYFAGGGSPAASICRNAEASLESRDSVCDNENIEISSRSSVSVCSPQSEAIDISCDVRASRSFVAAFVIMLMVMFCMHIVLSVAVQSTNLYRVAWVTWASARTHKKLLRNVLRYYFQ